MNDGPSIRWPSQLPPRLRSAVERRLRSTQLARKRACSTTDCATLKHLRIDASNYKVLKLLPLVYVAWNAGSISPVRVERLVDLAHNHFAIGKAGEQILRGWLLNRPTRAYFMEGLHDLLLLARAPDEWQFELTELPALLAYSEAIARTTAQAMDAPGAVTPGEEEALAEIARELEVDDGVSWAALLRELQGSNAGAAAPLSG